MGVAEDLQEYPLCDLGTVDTRGVGEYDVCFFPDWCFGQMVCTSAEEVNQLQIGDDLE